MVELVVGDGGICEVVVGGGGGSSEVVSRSVDVVVSLDEDEVMIGGCGSEAVSCSVDVVVSLDEDDEAMDVERRNVVGKKLAADTEKFVERTV